MAILRERSLSTALFAKLPVIEETDRGFSECCYEHLVLADADPGANKIERNDFTLQYLQRQTTIDTCDFVLIKLSDLSEYSLNNNVYGVFKDFGDHLDAINLTTIELEWKKVLIAHGPGQYRIRKDYTVAGIPVSETTYAFSLKNFTFENADKTFRFDIVMNGYLERDAVSFKNANVKHSLRTRGFFGNVDPEHIEDKTVYRKNVSNTPTFMNIKAIYKLQSDPLPSCIVKEFVNFMMLANDKWFSDYNSNNHDYDLIRIEVVFNSTEGRDYWSTSRNSRLNYTFSERYLNNNKRNC